MGRFHILAAAIASLPSKAARLLDVALSSIEDSIAGLSADGTFSMASAAAYKAVYVSAADTVALADADAVGKKMAVGITASAPTGSTAVVRFVGIITGAGSFTAGALQYVSTTAGALTETPPSAPNATPIAIAINTTDLLVLGPLGAAFNFLRGTSAADGANGMGYDDSGSKTTAATVGDALDELYLDRLSTSRGCVPIPLSMWRIVSSTGDVGDTTANGGVMSSNTDPTLEGETTTNSWVIKWAANSVVPIGVSIPLPPDLDDTGDAYLEVSAFSGTTNAASFALASSWDGGSEVTDAFDDSATKSATRHLLVGTIDKGDIPAGATHVTFRLTPPAHSTNAIYLAMSRLRYTPKLLAS